MIVDLFSLSFFYSVLIFNFPASYLLRHQSIRCSLATGVFFTIVGTLMRIFINESFRAALAGQCIAAAGFSFFFNAPSQISSRWFAPREVRKHIILEGNGYDYNECELHCLQLHNRSYFDFSTLQTDSPPFWVFLFPISNAALPDWSGYLCFNFVCGWTSIFPLTPSHPSQFLQKRRKIQLRPISQATFN